MEPKKKARRRPSRGAKEPLVISGDLVVPPTIMGWERELLLPVVVPLVQAMWAAAEKTEAEKEGKPSP